MRKSELRAGGSIIGLTLVFVLTALLAACGGSDDVTVGELNTQEPTAAGQPVMSTAPLSQLPGSPFIADDTALWYTDFSSIARFDIAAVGLYLAVAAAISLAALLAMRRHGEDAGLD